MYCTGCAVRLVDEARFCHMCGSSVARSFRGIEAKIDIASETRSVGDGRADTYSAERGVAGPFTVAPVVSTRGDREPESELWEGGFSPRAMFGSFATLALASLASLGGSAVALYRDADALGMSLLLVVPVVWLAQLVRAAKRCWGLRYRLTDRRLFLQAGVLSRHRDQLDLARVEDVRTHQNVLHRFFDIGSIEIRSRDRHLRRVVMTGIPSADDVADLIRRAARRLQPAPPIARAAKAS
jgi:membrane protein YdbS with pleckstrin-like domain